jgi:hypothetical protein
VRLREYVGTTNSDGCSMRALFGGATGRNRRSLDGHLWLFLLKVREVCVFEIKGVSDLVSGFESNLLIRWRG